MRAVEIHTVPLWEEQDGSRRLGMEPDDNHPPVVGWCNVIVVDINGDRHELLLTGAAYE